MKKRRSKEQIRVMQIITRLNIGGPSRVVTLAARGLQQAGFRTLLVTGRLSPGEGGMYREAMDAGLALEIVPELQRSVDPWADSLALAGIAARIRSFRPHVIHTHLSKAGLLGRLAGLFSFPVGLFDSAARPRLVHTFHGHVFSGYFGSAGTTAFLEAERFMGLFTSALVALSVSQKQELTHLYRIADPDRFTVIPLGFDHLDSLWDAACNSSRRSELRHELGLDDSAVLLGTVGRLVPIKDHAMLLDAFGLLTKRIPQAHLVIVGDGDLRARIEARAARADVAGRVHLLGWRSDLERIYAGLDLFVMSSLNEGTPVSLIEAIAAGLPVVATAVGGVGDILDHGRLGKLVPVGDVQALARAMEEASKGAASPVTRQTAVSGSELVRRRYSSSRFIEDLVALYRRVLATQPG